MSLAQGNNTPTRPRIELGSPDPESDALTTRPVRPPLNVFDFICKFFEIYAYTEKLIDISILHCDFRFGEINDHS